ncbi:hypothetical protein GKQ77_03825 [Streptomyces sp. BG9H]|uniref:ParB-like N-terminal domain-containing protein n=1 Tax=Streptomyces anatolicus TaxID=2675858 RepID=A0ABS6YI00_9ACTN|nr:ParB/RepB/Spo0J family partition protein [Streptomyces anatolicus]MBW5420699.1 hypothetical protein [Streptomyces anatolicus]
MALYLASSAGPGRQVTQTVPLSVLLPSDSPRVAGEDEKHIERLAGLDTPLPPILVHRSTMRVIDGMHRLRAAALRGMDRIAVEFFEGDEEEAFVLAVKLNAAHGLPLSQTDRAHAAARIIASRPHWSDRRIASVTGLAPGSIAALRTRSTEQNKQLKKRVGRDGRLRPLNPTEGRMRASRLLDAKPSSTLKEIAEAAGISAATAKDVRDRVRAGKDPLPPRLRRDAGTRQGPPEPVTPSPRTPQHMRQAASAGGESALVSLHRDPSMRTDAGRALLQLLQAHSIRDEGRLHWLAESVPAHRRAAMAQAARACAERWLRLAKVIEADS